MNQKPLLTIFSAPKPFKRKHIALIQRNAIRSWLALGDEVEVLLIGDEPGLAEVAAEMGVEHIPEVARNAQGTPLVSDIFAQACQAASTPYMCYVNGDIIFLSDFLAAVKAVIAATPDRFLMVGRRWDLDITTPLEFSPGWEMRLRTLARTQGRLHSPFGIDYFVFPHAAFAHMPPFAVGRSGWDNWMIYHSREQGWKVIDATDATTVIHQNHDYAHLPGGQPHYKLEESQENIRMAGGPARMFSIWEANYALRDGRLRRIWRPLPTTLRKVERAILTSDPNPNGWRRLLLRRVRRMLRALM